MGKLGDITIENISSTEFKQKKLENLGQYLDINYKVTLNKNSSEQDVKKEILASQKLNDLQYDILAYLQKKYTDVGFNLDDIKDYFSKFKSPYHDIKSSVDSAKTVSYTSEHLNRYLKEEDWLSKYGKKTYKEAIYVNENRKDVNGNLIRFRMDNNHMGIDLSLSKYANVYMTNFGKSYAFPQGSSDNGGLGNVVVVQHYIYKDTKSYPLNIATVYAHLEAPQNSSQDQIDGNNTIGKEGGTGRNPEYASHLHLELWKIDDALASREDITSLASVRKTNSKDLSYSYRYINATFQAFKDVTGSTDFKVLDDTQKNVEQKSTATYVVTTNPYTKNAYMKGNTELNIKSILSLSKNYLNKNTSDKFIYKFEYESDKNLYFEDYSLENLNTTLSDIESKTIHGFETFTIQETREIDSKILYSRFKFKFRDYLNALGDTANLNQDKSKIFGKNMLKAKNIKNEKEALFTFYFPIRLSVFKKNYNNLGGTIQADEIENLIRITESCKKNFFIRFKIFDLFMDDIFNISYDKLTKSFNTKIIENKISESDIKSNFFVNGNSPDNYYAADIVSIWINNNHDIEFISCEQKNEYSTIIFDNNTQINFFNFKYDITKYDHDYGYQNLLNLKLYANENLQKSFEIKNADFDKYNKYANFINNYKIPFGARYLTDDETDQKFNTDFTRSYVNFFNEEKDESDDNITLPKVFFSNEFDTIGKLPKEFELSDKILMNSILIVTNNDYYNTTKIDLDNKNFAPDFNFHPSFMPKCNPFVESIFFDYRIESSYLPKCIYNNEFVATKKMRTSYDFRDHGRLCNYYFPPELREIKKEKDLFIYSEDKYKEFNVNDFGSQGSKELITNIKTTKEIRKYFQDEDNSPVYTFYLNLNDLYFEIIYNMINIDIYNIED